MKPRVFVTRLLPGGAMQVLNDNFDVQCNPHDRVLSRQELLAGVKDKDGILPLLTDRIDAELLEAAGPQLKIVANYAVGYNNIDVPACTSRKIPATNTPGVLTDTTADLAMTLLLAVARKIVPADAYARAGKYQGLGAAAVRGDGRTSQNLGDNGIRTHRLRLGQTGLRL